MGWKVKRSWEGRGVCVWHLPRSLIHIGSEADKEHFPDKCHLFNYFQFPLNSQGCWGSVCRLCSLWWVLACAVGPAGGEPGALSIPLSACDCWGRQSKSWHPRSHNICPGSSNGPLVPGRLAGEQGRVYISIKLKQWKVRVGILRHLQFLRRPILIWFLIQLWEVPTHFLLSPGFLKTPLNVWYSPDLPHFCFHYSLSAAANLSATVLGASSCTSL